MKDVIFFDLDGTLTKSEEGIIRCVQYALRELGMPVPAKKDLFYFIGPPLVDSFLTLPGFTEAMALEATALYGNATLQSASLKMNCTQALRTYWRRLMRQGSCLLRHRPNRKFLCATLPIILALRLIFGKLAVLPSMPPGEPKVQSSQRS